jgi:hypothetical protein
MAQSTLFDSHSPKRPLPTSSVPVHRGVARHQVVAHRVVRTNHEPRA